MTFQVAEFKNSFDRPDNLVELTEGVNIIDILRTCNVEPEQYLGLEITISMGQRSNVVPMDMWRKVRPRKGAHVLVTPILRGPLVAALLSAVVATAAPAIASAIFPGLAVGSFGLALATAAVSVVGMLLIRTLIPPPKQLGSTSEDPVYVLSRSSNRATPYEPYPMVIGRHVMSPIKTATGYTEAIGEDIFLRERMTFGYGPVALSELKIGNTLLKEFDDVEVEFLNVDQTLTEAAMPELTNGDITVRGWRTGTDAMVIYPDDVTQDDYNVLLEKDTSVVRNTRVDTDSASVDVSFNSLGTHNSKGRKQSLDATHTFEFRVAESGDAWTLHDTITWTDNSTVFHRFSVDIPFPTSDEYEIRVTRTNVFHDDNSQLNGGTLTAIRSVSAGGLPSHSDIAEIAIRLRATEELNGALSTVNAVVQQLARVWDGASFSPPVPIRHPAWSYLRALTGPMLRDPVADSRIMLDDLKAWADDQPHWTCDMVLTGSRRLADVLDLIAASGRARRGMSDLNYSIIRDGADGGVVQHFTPENSWGFTGRRFLDRQLHALRIKTVSELKNWGTEEVIVYNDGFNAGNATEIETMELPGVILDFDDGTEGNAWRLGRYHMAVAQLRPEEFTFSTDLDHLVCQMGDKVRVVHDVPLFGIGSGRITTATTTTLTLDELLQPGAGSFRLRIREFDNSETTVSATVDAAGVWTFDTPLGAAPDVGDLVLAEQMSIDTADLLITKIHHMGDLQAQITCVPAAPAVLTADTGEIPLYDPLITDPTTYGPPLPVVLLARSGLSVAITETDLSLTPRIGVQVEPQMAPSNGPIHLRTRWRVTGGAEWTASDRLKFRPELFTTRLEVDQIYDVEVATFDAEDRSRGWVRAATALLASTSDNPLPAVTGWVTSAGVDSITLSGPATANLNRDFYRIYASTSASTALIEVGTSTRANFTYKPLATGHTRYKVAQVDFEDREGDLTAYFDVVPAGVVPGNVTEELFDLIEADAIAISNGLIDSRVVPEITRIDGDIEAIDSSIEAIDGSIVEINHDLQISQIEQRTVGEAIGIINDDVLFLLTNLTRMSTEFADAGLHIDPASGKAVISGVVATGLSVAEAEIRLDASEAEIVLRVTFAEMNAAISEAVLDPSQIPIIGDLELRISTVEIDLSAAEADILLKASTTTVSGIEVRLTTAEVDIDGLEGTITLKVDQTDFDALESRMTTAEIELDTIDGASIQQTVADTRYLGEKFELSEDGTLRDLLDFYADRKLTRVDLAFAKSDIRALVDEDRVAIAEQRVELGAQIDGNTSSITVERTARVDADSALASDIVTLQADLQGDISANSLATSDLSIRVTSTEGVVVSQAQDITTLQSDVGDAEDDIIANASATSNLSTRVTSAEGTITTQSQDITTLQGDLVDAEGVIVANVSAISNLSVRVTSAEGTIVSQSQDIVSLQSSLEIAEDDIIANASATSNLSTRVTSAEGTITTQSQDITTLENDLDIAENGVSANVTAISNLSNRVTVSEGTILLQSQDITTLENDLETAEGDIVSNASATTALTTRVTSAEGTITTQSQDITTLENTVNDPSGGVVANATAATALTSRVTTSEGTITAQGLSIVDLSTTSGEHTSSIQTTLETVDGVLAEETLRIDNNGVISGRIIRSEIDDLGTPATEVAFLSDKFAIVSPIDGTSQRTAPFEVFTVPTTVGGKLIPPGVYMRNAKVFAASITRLQMEDTIQSDNYAEDGGGLPTAGMKLDFQTGEIKSSGIVLSRQLIIATGSFTQGGTFGDGDSWDFINTGIKVSASDVWQSPNVSLVAVAAITSGATGGGGLDPNNSFWSLEAAVQPGARWNGFPGVAPTNVWQRDPTTTSQPYWSTGVDQRVYIGVDLAVQGPVSFINPTIQWTLFQVT